MAVMNFKERTLFQLFKEWLDEEKAPITWDDVWEFMEMREEVIRGEKPHDVKHYSKWCKSVKQFIKEEGKTLRGIYTLEDIDLKSFSEWLRWNDHNFRVSRTKITKITQSNIRDFIFRDMTGLWVGEAKEHGVI